MSEPKYDAAYFIAKFEAIPEENWTTGQFIDKDGRCCARGHCGERNNSESDEVRALFRISCATLRNKYKVAELNDGELWKYPQPTPKQRVLAWLRDAKEAGL